MFLLGSKRKIFFFIFTLLTTSIISLIGASKETSSSRSNTELNNFSAVAFHPFFPYVPKPPPSTAQSQTTTTTQRNMAMRAWTCHGKTQKEMVDKLVMAKIITSNVVRDVMYKVDRKNYVPSDESAAAYFDAPMPIGLGQTISAPHMHAHVLEEIIPYIQKSESEESSTLSLLDVGCGSGYLTAALGRWVDPNTTGSDGNSPIVGKIGKVYGIDVYPDLVERTKQNIQKGDKDLLDSGLVTIQVGDGWKGLPNHSPFDAIHVGAAADTFPTALMMQLRVGGVLVVPVGPQGGVQTLYKIERMKENSSYHDADFNITNLLGVRYVPLVHRN